MKKNKPSFFFILTNRLKKKNFLFEFYFKGKRTLDVGCGQGEFIANDPKNIIGIDINESVIESLSGQGYGVKLCGADNLSFDDGEFEAVHCRNVIEHMEISTAYRMIKEIARVLKRDGIFVLCSEMPTRHFWSTFGHVKPYPPQAIKKLIKKDLREGFEFVEGFDFINVFYFGQYFNNKIIYFLSILISYYLPLGRREYFLVLKRR